MTCGLSETKAPDALRANPSTIAFLLSGSKPISSRIVRLISLAASTVARA